MSVRETIRWRESPLETQRRVSGMGGENPEGRGKGRAQSHILQFAVLHTPYGRLTSRHTWRWPLSHGAILSVRTDTDSLPLWLFQSDFVFKVCSMVAFMHKGHEAYLSSAYGSMVFCTQQTAVYKRPAHVFPHTALPAHQKLLYVLPINNLQFLETSIPVTININELCQVIMGWNFSIQFRHPNTQLPLFRYQWPSYLRVPTMSTTIHTRREYVYLSEDCPECLKPQWVQALAANRLHITHLAMKQLSASLEALPPNRPSDFIS